ncbi:MAG: CBS domain-containing protein [bacterium]|nr:CBS domain-containing protein [bacterium]
MRQQTAKDVMSETVVTVRDDLTLWQVSEILAEHKISGAPVEDDEGSLLGVVSVTDVNRSAAEPQLKARQIMTPIADTVSEETTVPEIARIMVGNHYHRVIVTRREKPVGIVSSMDLLKLVAEL